MAESAVQILLGSIGQLLREEYRNLRGISGGIAEIRDELATMNALRLMRSEADSGSEDHFERECMRQLCVLAFDTEDCLDWYMYKIRRRPSANAVLAWVKTPVAKLFRLRRLAGEIATLRDRAIAISERRARYSASHEAMRQRQRRSLSLLPAAPLRLRVPLEATEAPTLVVDDARRHRRWLWLVGIEEQADTLAARLKAPVGEDERMAVFSIMGSGGVGKTTLATEVCWRLQAEFPCQAMVSVSEPFEPSRDIRVLLKDLLGQLVEPKAASDRDIGALMGAIDVQGENLLAKELQDLLADKRYLIVIDDVWTMEAWQAIQSKLPENNKGGRIIMITQIKLIAYTYSSYDASGHHCIHEIEPLKLEDSKKLFLNRVFGSMDASYPKEFEDAMDDMLEKCGGLPMAIVSIANVLVGYLSPESKGNWDILCKSIGSQLERQYSTLERMKHIVTFNYNHLPQELKGCMMYFSIFPENYVIKKDRLLNRWMAEGLVHEKRGLTMWEVAEYYLDELLSRNMIQEVQPFDGFVWRKPAYKVHDIILKVMVSKSLEANFLSLYGGQHKGILYDNIRRLSIHASIEGVNSIAKTNIDSRQGEDNLKMEYVRSLSMFQFHGQHKILEKLGNFALLRVLDLEDCEGVTDKHVRYACNLYLLRFLSLKGTNITKVPRQIENLEHLQTLDLGDTCLTGLPKSITMLEKLEYMWFSSKDDYWKTMWTMPRGIQKMKSLRVLRGVCLGNDHKVAQEVGELENLVELVLSIDNNKTVDEEVLRELALSISKMQSLRLLYIGRHGRSYHGDNILKFLHHLPTPPRLLRTLWITGDIDRRLPSWIGSLTYLVSLTILDTTLDGDEPFGVLSELPLLSTLHVTLEFYMNHQLIARANHAFLQLRYLRLGGALPHVLRFERGSMEKLEMLELDFDGRSRRVAERSIDGVENLTNLKMVMLESRDDCHALLQTVLEQLKDENHKPSRFNKFQISVTYL